MKPLRAASCAASASIVLTAALGLGCRGILGVEDGTPRANAGGSGGGAGSGGSGGGAGVAPAAPNPSCRELARTCGPTGASDCCARALIPGGTFRRSYDAKSFTDSTYRATVSDFVLDTYEVSVGRFQKFVAEYSKDMLAQGVGKNPNDPSDPGWDSAWNASLPADATALACDVYGTSLDPATPPCGTADVPDASLPITDVSWYVAFAFCVWDGGRLPTEAEWNYAAAGGAEQRVYPWGTAAPDATRAVANLPEASTPEGPERVGSTSPAGDGKWGHADLAGNVAEWNLDWYFSPYAQVECVNCANTAEGSTEPYPGSAFSGNGDVDPPRVVRGGGFWSDAPVLLSSYRSVTDCSVPACRTSLLGVRCARNAP